VTFLQLSVGLWFGKDPEAALLSERLFGWLWL
jgi:hypothetical protein